MISVGTRISARRSGSTKLRPNRQLKANRSPDSQGTTWLRALLGDLCTRPIFSSSELLDNEGRKMNPRTQLLNLEGALLSFTRVTARFVAVVEAGFAVLGSTLMLLFSTTYSIVPCPTGGPCTSTPGMSFTVNAGAYAGALVAFAGLSFMLGGALR